MSLESGKSGMKRGCELRLKLDFVELYNLSPYNCASFLLRHRRTNVRSIEYSLTF
jgi:hypothetical protein